MQHFSITSSNPAYIKIQNYEQTVLHVSNVKYSLCSSIAPVGDIILYITLLYNE